MDYYSIFLSLALKAKFKEGEKPKDDPKREQNIENITLFSAPWPSAPYRIEGYLGGVSGKITSDKSFEDGVLEVLNKLKEDAYDKGANCVLGIEISVDWWAEPPVFEALGLSAIYKKM